VSINSPLQPTLCLVIAPPPSQTGCIKNHPSIHSYIHTFIHSYIHTFIHSSIHPYIHPARLPHDHTSNEHPSASPRGRQMKISRSSLLYYSTCIVRYPYTYYIYIYTCGIYTCIQYICTSLAAYLYRRIGYTYILHPGR
jgi:hypothetical protein